MADGMEHDVSWWVVAQRGDRDAFYASVAKEAGRLSSLTHDPRLNARGETEKPRIKGGRTPGEDV